MADEWSWVRLRKLCDPERGITYGVVQPGDFEQAGIPILRADNVKNGSVNIEGLLRVSADIEKNYNRSRLRGGEVLLTLVGAYLGKSAVTSKEHAGLNTARAVGVIPVIRDAHYVSYALRSPLCQNFIWERATTTAQPTLNLRDVADILIPWPSASIRRRVTEVLQALDHKIELNRRMNETLEAMVRTIFKDWFVDFGPVRGKQEGRAPYLAPDIWSLFPDRVDDEGKPDGWEFGALGQVAEPRGEIVDPGEVDPDTPYIGLEHMPRGSIALSEWAHAGKVTSNKSRFAKGDILFGKLRPYFHKVGIAPLDGICSTDIVVFGPKEKSWFSFVLVHTSGGEFVAHADRTSTGTKMPRSLLSHMQPKS